LGGHENKILCSYTLNEWKKDTASESSACAYDFGERRDHCGWQPSWGERGRKVGVELDLRRVWVIFIGAERDEGGVSEE
jgi:hypothetical protein